MFTTLAFRVTSLLNKILPKRQVLLISRLVVKPQQCELDLRVAWVAVFLLWKRPKSIAEQVHVLDDWLQQEVIVISLVMCQCSLN